MTGAVHAMPDPGARQRAAADPATSVWVSASAGSGKTKVLTDRVLSLLLEGTPPQHILCLTFTRAAAAEMANRVNTTLSSWATVDDGNRILGHILGSKDASRQVAQKTSERTGIDSGILKKMLPVVATMVMGSLSKNKANFAGSGSGSSGGLGKLLDADGDGSIMDDIAGMLGKVF